MTKNRQSRKQNGHEDPLDLLLGKARWAEPSPESLERLEAYWWDLRKRGRIVRLLPVAGAAAVLIALSSSLWWIARRPQLQVSHEPEITHTQSQRNVIVRPPTLLEQMMILPDIQRAERRVRFERETNFTERLGETVEQIVATPQTDISAVARKLVSDADLEIVEVILVRELQKVEGEKRVVLLRLLGEVATGRSLPLLLEFLDDPSTRYAAMPGVIRLGGARTLATLVTQETDPLTQRRLLAQLGRSDPRQVVPVYLYFIEHEETSASALSALKDIPAPPRGSVLRLFETRKDKAAVGRSEGAGGCGQGGRDSSSDRHDQSRSGPAVSVGGIAVQRKRTGSAFHRRGGETSCAQRKRSIRP